MVRHEALFHEWVKRHRERPSALPVALIAPKEAYFILGWIPGARWARGLLTEKSPCLIDLRMEVAADGRMRGEGAMITGG